MKPNTESAPLSLLEDGWSTLCFHELFERQVARTPDAIAVSFQGRHLTYRDLNRRANQVGHYLQSVGIGPEKVVGMYWPRAENVDALLVLLMGILKAGGAYLYLDTDRSMLPTERMLGMVADARTSIILTQQRLRSTLPPCETSIVCHDAPQVAQAIAGKSERNPISGSSMTSLAYVIYTSGSTGQPKGVLLTHRGIGNLARSYIEAFAVRPGDRIAQFFSYSFDASVSEIATGLLSGASLYPVPAEAFRSGPALTAFLEAHALTIAQFTPSSLAVLPVTHLPSLRVLIVGGEVCPAELVARWSAPGRLVVNAYGPTESTVCATFGLCANDGRPPTLGRALPNTLVTIRDEQHLPVCEGEAGEICISGIGLARGYTDPALTAQRFVTDPLDPQTRLYLTGDRGYVDPNGHVIFLGRVTGNTTIKVRGGFRVDLAEIEAVLLPFVTACAVLPSDEGQLIACVVFAHGQATSVKELREHLQAGLPGYMLPRAIVVLDTLPRTPSEKVDREALRRMLPNWRQLAQDGVFQPARTAVELHVAEIVAETLNSNLGTSLRPQEVNLGKGFTELGGDSLSMADVLLRFATVFHVEMEEDQLYTLPLTHIAALLETSRREGEGACQPHEKKHPG